MRLGLTTVLALLVAVEATSVKDRPDESEFYRTFKCIGGSKCQRTSTPISSIDPDVLKAKGEHTSQSACRLVCGNNPGVWPIPTGKKIEYGHDYVSIHPMKIWFNNNNILESTQFMLDNATTAFLYNIVVECGAECRSDTSSPMMVSVEIESDDVKLDWNTNEQYNLTIETTDGEVKAVIKAITIYGARHGLETLSQLTAPVLIQHGHRGVVILNRAHIEDGPVFPHRGLLIDTARTFLPKSEILKTIDALAATKMNVLHWHATDSQSFPLQIDRRPLMSRYGAYASDMMYTLADLEKVVKYGRLKGVRVILELDSPSHAGAGWEWGPAEGLGNLAVCLGQEPWRKFCVQPPCGQLNPVNPNTSDVLRDIYKDVLSAMDGERVLHLGGDEVHINCWNSTDEITSIMKSRGMGRGLNDFHRLWGEFHANQAKILSEINGRDNDSIILWSSKLTQSGIIEDHLDKNKFVIQTSNVAKSSLPRDLLNLGYRIIITTKNAWYLTQSVWGDTTYYNLKDVYKNRILRNKGVLGGEACMWGEYVNTEALQTRIWPRTAAIAERLWSDPTNTDVTTILPRLEIHNKRLRRRGIAVDTLGAEWCAYNEQRCA